MYAVEIETDIESEFLRKGVSKAPTSLADYPWPKSLADSGDRTTQESLLSHYRVEGPRPFRPDRKV